MDNLMRLQAETAARLLLQDYRKAHPDWIDNKTPVDAVATWLGLQVATFHPSDYVEGTYGFIDPDEDENLIWLCRDLSETLHRFTLAHELGHIILHCHSGRRFQELVQHFSTKTELISPALLQTIQQHMPDLSPIDPCHDLDVQADMTGYLDEEPLQEVLGLGQSYDPRSQRELAANFFAAELLLPFERIRTLYLEQRVSPDQLAHIFGVSPAALLNRLAGLLKPPITLTKIQQTLQTSAPIKKHYDEFQQAAIQTSTPALIVAGPGSGKTSTLIGRIEYLIDTLNVQPEHILALTFSRKATQEMEDRLQQVLASKTQTIPTIPKVSTFHAFCADLLRKHAGLAGLRTDFSLIDEAEGYFLLRQLANQMHLHHYQQLWSPTHYFPDILKAISRAKDELVSPTDYTALAQRMLEQAHDEESCEKAEKALEIAHIYTLYEEELRRRGDSDFGGLLTLILQLFHEQPQVLHAQQQKYQHILVDEFQDMNRASAVLLRELAGTEKRVWVVGDANQAIYAFRGASPANIREFEQDFPGAFVLPLGRNYRSRPDLVAIAESFRSQRLEPEDDPTKNQPVRPTHPEQYVTLAQAVDENSEMAGILQDIRSKHASGYAYKDMAILCRRRAQAQKISTVLAQAGLPVIEQGSTLDQDYMKDILAMLLLLVNSTGMGLLRAACQPEHAFTQQDIEALLLAAREPDTNLRQLLISAEAPLTMSTEGRHALIRLSKILQTLQRSPDIWSLLTHYLFIEASHIHKLLVSPESKQRNTILADYDRLLQLARHFDQQQTAHAKRKLQAANEQNQDGPLLPPLEERIKGFLEYLTLLVLLRQDGGNRHGNDENNGEHANIIHVMTVHASKGLEFPIVYMPELVQQRFPFRSMPNPVPAPRGMLPEASTGKNAHETSEACLFYVGITRARDHLILTSSERYGKKAYKRSTFLDALEAGLPAERISKLQWDHPIASATPPTDAINWVPTPHAINCQDVHDTNYTTDAYQPSADFINAMRPSTLSSSAIEAYLRCPRQYAYDSIYHFSADPTGYQLFRTAIRKTVEELRIRCQRINTGELDHIHIPTQQEIQQLYTHHWQELNGHTTPFAALYEQHGHEVVEALRHKLITQSEFNWDLHMGLDVDIASITVRVTIDRVETMNKASTPVRFVRTRFGKSKEKPTVETRELLYILAHRQHHPEQSVELHSHNMSTDEVMPMKLTQKKEQSLRESIEQAIQGLQDNHYPAQPSQPARCPNCPFFWICPA
jgi:DNA helicase-2/ATP-dependent DNA helicase PcrA